jgi:hypothetical protein
LFKLIEEFLLDSDRDVPDPLIMLREEIEDEFDSQEPPSFY